jgi:predicted TIM-barrel fold metal-dependent hydrolase
MPIKEFAIRLAPLIVLASVTTGRPAHEAPTLINFHEHIQSIENVSSFLKAMQSIGVKTTVILGSPESVFMYGADGFHGEDANNREILKIARAYPDAFIPFPTINVDDSNKLEKLEQYLKEGAKGLKLYSGSAIYHTVPLDDPSMIPVYKLCLERRIPILFHVHFKRYGIEFERVLARFPNLPIICPHFCLSSVKIDQLDDLMDRYPHLYTDISFGYIRQLKAGLRRFSKNPKKYRRFILRHQDRILFGTDMVVMAQPDKDSASLTKNAQVYRDLLEKKEWVFWKSCGSF